MSKAPENYEEWKSGATAGVRASGWLGWAIGNFTVCLIFALPIYLVVALIAGSLTLIPSTVVEIAVYVGIAMALFVTARGKGKPDHLTG